MEMWNVLDGIVAVGVASSLHLLCDLGHQGLAAFDFVDDTQEESFMRGGVPAASGLGGRCSIRSFGRAHDESKMK